MPRAPSPRRRDPQTSGRSAPRCAYTENGRRCPYVSDGSDRPPPLCRAHRLALAQASRPRSPMAVIAETFADLLQGRPINQDATIGAIQDVASQWAGLAADYRPDVMPGESEGAAHRRAQAGTQTQARPWWWNIGHMAGGAAGAGARGPRASGPPPAPGPDPAFVAQQEARRVLGLEPDEALTEKAIKARQRALAKKFHPDHGGSPEKMAAVNHAVDVLMAAL